MRYAAKRDASEKLIVEALRKSGCSVYIMDKPVDLLVGLCGQTFLAECKTPGTQYGKKLNKNQQDFQDNWRGASIVTLRTIDDAFTFVDVVKHYKTLPRAA